MPGGLVGTIRRVSLARIPMRPGGVQKAFELLHVGFVHVRRAAKKRRWPRNASCNRGRVPTYECSGGYCVLQVELAGRRHEGELDPRLRVAADRLGLGGWRLLAELGGLDVAELDQLQDVGVGQAAIAATAGGEAGAE